MELWTQPLVQNAYPASVASQLVRAPAESRDRREVRLGARACVLNVGRKKAPLGCRRSEFGRRVPITGAWSMSPGCLSVTGNVWIASLCAHREKKRHSAEFDSQGSSKEMAFALTSLRCAQQAGRW